MPRRLILNQNQRRNMLNVRVKDFQSIGDISFDISGFTVIVGKNNLGKSAIVRAIDAALTNRPGSEFVRWGKTKSEVTLKKDDLNVKWQKGDTAVYEVNGQSYSKLNRAVPQPIIDAGIKKIEVGDKKFNPLVAHQFEELFLLDEPGSVITEFLSIIYNLNILSDADNLCLKELRAGKSLLKTREADLTLLKENIDKYKDLDSIKKELVDIKALDKKCASLQSALSDINDYINRCNIVNRNISVLNRVSDITIPNTDKIDEKSMEFSWLNNTIAALKTLLVSVKNLKTATLVSIPEYNSTSNMIQITEELSELNQTYSAIIIKIEKQKLILEALKDTDSVSKISAIQETINVVEELFKLHSIYNNTQRTTKTLENSHLILQSIDCLSTVDIEKGIQALDHVKDISEKFTSSVKTVRELKTELDKTNLALESEQKNYSEFETCPLCLKTL